MDWDTRVGCYAWVERVGDGGEPEVLLSRYAGHRLDDGRLLRPLWVLPGGGLELRESPEEAVVREVAEETGYAVRLTRMLGVQALRIAPHDRARPSGDRAAQSVQLLWEAQVLSGELRPEADGSSNDAGWFTRAQMEELACGDTVPWALRLLGREPLRQEMVPGPVDEESVQRVHAALATAVPRAGGVRVIAVDGPSGSGKTVLAAALAQDLRCPVVHMDDLFPGWGGLAQGPGLVTEQVLEPLARGERAAYRRFDWVEEDWAETVPVPPSDVLVVEGCGSSVGAAGEFAAVRVWVEADTEARMRRGIDRDGEDYRPHWERWAVQERDLFAADRTRERADVVVDSGPRLG